MGIEIERRFLVQGDGYRDGARAVAIRQGYLSRDRRRVVRVRVAGTKGFLTVKGEASGPRRSEFEYEIPLTDAETLLELCLPIVIEKTRYVVEWRGRTWEIDVFAGDNAGLVVAECELDDVAEPVEAPPWLGAEITEDRRYSNAQLARLPYCTW